MAATAKTACRRRRSRGLRPYALISHGAGRSWGAAVIALLGAVKRRRESGARVGHPTPPLGFHRESCGGFRG